MDNKRIAIIGGGPSGLFMFKQLVNSGLTNINITIFESKSQLGVGMPYGHDGANREHITNVSGNEIPDLVNPISEWIKTLSAEQLLPFNIDPEKFNDYKVLPRLLFGRYLHDQFELLLEKAKSLHITTTVLLNTKVTDIIDQSENEPIKVEVENKIIHSFDEVVICIGHQWPLKNEKANPGYFDSPYPPAKLAKQFNHPVAIRGASLTAIDAIRTLARQHGIFCREASHKLSYQLNKDAAEFKMVMHSRHGLLPGIRFHLEDSHLSKDSLLTPEEIKCHRNENDGFLSLDFIFDKDFKESFRDKDPAFFQRISKMTLEEFVNGMMDMRESMDAFELFKLEYAEAARSIRKRESVYWKEALAILSFAMNYPAKHLSAEDMLRLQKVLMPLISIVIAFVPQSSCEELIALHEAGILDIITVGEDGRIDIEKEGGIIYHTTDNDGTNPKATKYQTFVDCIGQPHLSIDQFPFKSLVDNANLSQATLKFRNNKASQDFPGENEKGLIFEKNGQYYLKVPGVKINDHFEAVNAKGEVNNRLFVMAVSFIGGYNPDYSGLDFCEEASTAIIKKLVPAAVAI